MSQLYIPVILGTARIGRKSEAVARYVFEFFKTLDIETELLDVKNFPQTYTEEKTEAIDAWKAKAKRADGYLIVSPEYNHSFPGELKLFLDNVYTDFHRKPMAFVGVSKGPLGGVRAIEQLRLVAVELQMVPTRHAVYFGSVPSLIDEQNNFRGSEEWLKKLTTLADELLWYARALKPEREVWVAAREAKK